MPNNRGPVMPGRGLARKFNAQADEYHSDDTADEHQSLSDTSRPLKRSKKIKSTLAQLTRALQRIVAVKDESTSTTQDYNDGPLAEISKALQRLAIKNNIKGGKVNTKQDVKEYNDEVVEALTRVIRRLDDQHSSYDESLRALTEKLRRIAIQNHITGKTVNTKQEVNEYNNRVMKELYETVRRLAVTNNYSGNILNPQQTNNEMNGDSLIDIAKNLILEGSSFKNDYDYESYDEAEVLRDVEKILAPLHEKLIKHTDASDELTSDNESSANRRYYQPSSAYSRRLGYSDYQNNDAYYDEAKKEKSDNEKENDDAKDDADEVEGDDDDYDSDEYENDYYDYNQDDYNYDAQSDEQARQMTANNEMEAMENRIYEKDGILSQNSTHQSIKHAETENPPALPDVDAGFDNTKVSSSLPQEETPKPRANCKGKRENKIRGINPYAGKCWEMGKWQKCWELGCQILFIEFSICKCETISE